MGGVLNIANKLIGGGEKGKGGGGSPNITIIHNNNSFLLELLQKSKL